MSSSTVLGDGADLVGILEQSRHNNAIDGVTGLLWSDGANFLQVIEGPSVSIDSAWGRICNDGRHYDIRELHDKSIVEREFGYWSMAHRRVGEASDIYGAHMCRLLAGASPSVRAPFVALIATAGKI